MYGFAGVEKWVDGKLVEAGEFVRAKVGAKIRPTSCYLMWTGYEPDYAPARGLTRSAAADEEMPQRITVKLVSASGETTAIGTLDTTTGEVSFDSGCAPERQAQHQGHLYQQWKKDCNQITNGGHSNEKESIQETDLQNRSVAT